MKKPKGKKISHEQKWEKLILEHRANQRAKKMGFGAPGWARKPAKTVNNLWTIPGGAIETNKKHH